MTSDLRRVSLIHNLHSVEFYRNVLHVGAGTLSRFHSRPLTQFTGSSNQQVGFTISNGYDDVYANLSAYTNVGSVTLGAPSDSCAGSPGMGCINNIATNLHGGCNENGVPCGDNGTGNCLETGTDFYQMYGQTYTTSIFWVGDFCNVTSQDPQESFPVQDVMDGNFQSAYIRNFGDGIPRITVELEQPISDPNLADWYAFIYNYSTSQWNQAYEGSGNFLTSPVGRGAPNPGIGWSLDEYHYQSNTTVGCPQVPDASADDIQVADESSGNDQNNYWKILGLSDYNVENPIGGCFVDDGSGNGYLYSFATYTDQNSDPSWEVTDPVPAKCAMDSHGFCAILRSSVETSSCDTGLKGPHGDIYTYAHKLSYDIDEMIGGTSTFKEVAVETQSIPPKAPCTITATYSPNNPAVYYGDPNLP